MGHSFLCIVLVGNGEVLKCSESLLANILLSALEWMETGFKC